MLKINNERPTKAIRNLGNMLIMKFVVLNKISGKLKINRFKIPNYA
jgi:translation initiation factor IF-1